MARLYTLEDLKKYPEFRNLKKIKEVEPNHDTIFDGVTDEIQREIFAPDPYTGFPRSDLAFMMSKDSAPEIAEYIQQNIMKPTGQTASFGSDSESADMALDMVKTRFESVSAYADRLKSMVESSYHKNEANKD